MRDKYIQTAESVTEGHPDKLCDTIADTVLDACLKHDPSARVACEALATAGKILVAGEITAKVLPDIPAIVARTVRKAGYETDYEIEAITHDQSTDIAEAVGGGKVASHQRGAGDQGIMYGYACLETDELLPLPVVLAHRLTRLLTDARKTGTIQGLGPDGKAQVSVEYAFGLPSRITSVVISCQHEADKSLDDLRREVMEYGYPTWFEWRIQHWGTRCNAYSCVELRQGDQTMRFETAWRRVIEIVRALSKKYPDQTVTYRWADAELGADVGEAVFQNGKIADVHIPKPHSKEAHQLAQDIMKNDLAHFNPDLSKGKKSRGYRAGTFEEHARRKRGRER